MANTLEQPAQSIPELNDKLQLIFYALKSQQIASPAIYGEQYNEIRDTIDRICGELQKMQIDMVAIDSGNEMLLRLAKNQSR